MRVNVCYDLSSGQIRQIDTSDALPQFDGCGCIEHELASGQSIHDITVAGHMVDVSAKALRKRTDAELSDYLAPSDSDIAALVASELADTDQYMMPDRNVPNRDEWITYRQLLRDLSKVVGSATDRLSAFPVRPDGVKPAERRARWTKEGITNADA